MHIYQTQDVCSSVIEFDIQDNILTHLCFLDGCEGNLKAISKLAVGRNVDEVIELLEGLKCSSKLTSCPDQLASALKHYKQN